VTDTAVLSGGQSPTGTITFSLYGPDNPTCGGAPAFSTSEAVAGNGTYTSDPFTPTASGTYRWVATYSGDANNTPVSTACGDPAETVVVAPPTVGQLTLTVSPQAGPLGSSVTSSATLTGLTNPTGTITFNLFGPGDPNCSGPPVFSSTKPVSGNGTYTSDPFTPMAAGTYRWTARYSGDAVNPPLTTGCDPARSVVIGARAVPNLTTTASPSVPAGGQLHDTAVLSGGLNPTGTVRFSLFGPGDATCSAAPVFSSEKPVAGPGTYASDPFTATAPGTYRWVAAYSGDANNSPVATACGEPGETVTVTPLAGGAVAVTKTADPASRPARGASSPSP
jgi:hypothetical protein